jgi:methionyl-tRNA formyltransferase
MNIIFFGTPEIALPILSTLHERYSIKLIVCKPDKPQNRGQKLISPPTKEFAIKYNIPCYQPDKLRNNENAYGILKEINSDFLIVVAYGLILPNTILTLPKVAPINVHFSLLPKYRGAAPVNWAIINGEKYTGVTTMFMNNSLDGGDILLQRTTIIDKKTAPALCNELAFMGSKIIMETVNNFSNIRRKKQNENKASYAPILKKEDGLINWNESAIEIERKIRGLLNWPTAYSYLNNKLVKFYEASTVNKSLNTNNVKPGEIVKITKNTFYIATGEGLLEIYRLQMEGKNILTAAEFLRGNRIQQGDLFNIKKH